MNILINNYCNLRCPYCFAEDEMHTNCVKDMSLEDFKVCIEYCKKFNDNDYTLKIIGGEPTLSPNFKTFLELGVNDSWFKEIVLFSNLTFNSEIRNTIIELNEVKHINLVPNINEFDLLIPSHRKAIDDNLDELSKHLRGFDCIGINIYKENMDLTQWFNIIKNHKNIKYLRYSIAVPSKKMVRSDNFDFYAYYHQFQNTLVQLSDFCALNNVEINCDCNNLPLCCFDADAIVQMFKGSKGILSYTDHCEYPVIDVCPDLTVIGCFGCSDRGYNKKLFEFNSYDELIKYLSNFKDKLARKECIDCIRYKKTGKSCACISCHKVEV